MTGQWRDISTAPKDGTIVQLRNACMEEPVRGHWGEYRMRGTDKLTTCWVSDFTPHEFFPFPSGRMVCPEEWKPDTDPVS